ncbi:MAG: DUF4905 domain-containing protein [Bacteroidota bacterium]
MVKLKKKILYDKNRQIFRLLLSPDGRSLLIEERDSVIKQAYFSCIDLSREKVVLDSYQPEDEKYWVGVENFTGGIIFFHKFVKPDMPMHSGIIAFDVERKNILWQNLDYSFLFMYQNRLFVYRQRFDTAELAALDPATGEVTDDMSSKQDEVDELGRLANGEIYSQNYIFPEVYSDSDEQRTGAEIGRLIAEITTGLTVSGKPEYLVFRDTLFVNYFSRNKSNRLNNNFLAIDIVSGKIIFKEVLDSQANAYVPDSFFIKDDHLFLLKGKTGVQIMTIK